jgi:diguanylate cyclase (GGDEF)-like protein
VGGRSADEPGVMNPPQPSQPDPMIGQVLDGRYELTEFIAEGGMGVVYKARQRALDREVVVKLLLTDVRSVDEFQQRFFLEASLCARLNHPNIVRIFDYGCHAGTTYYIVMEHLKGMTLGQRLGRKGYLPTRSAVALARQVCAALVEAHDEGLIHRDIKPDNLIISEDVLGRDFIKILDFGVVKQLSGSHDVTQVGKAVGTPLYMSPEQITGGKVDCRSDLYALGCVLFQMLTGSAPFPAGDLKQILFGHLSKPPPTLTQARSSIRPNRQLQDLMDKSLRKEPQRRFENARAMLSDLVALEASLPLPMDDPDVGGMFDDEETQLAEAPTIEIDHQATMISDSIEMEVAPEDSQPRAERGSTPTAVLLEGVRLEGYVAFIDFNCPYCFALHERLCRWGLVDQIEWSMIEHADHLVSPGEQAAEEDKLSDEVFEVRHRAPDIELHLPLTRARATPATRLIAQVQSEAPDRVDALRRSVFRSLWQRGEDIGDSKVLVGLLRQSGLDALLLQRSEADSSTLDAWQHDWQSGGFDRSIPVLTHRASKRQMIGLPAERALAEFLTGKHKLVVDELVCLYQRKPTLLVCGWMSHLWALLADARERCEILQASSLERATELLNQQSVPDLVLIEAGHLTDDETFALGALARSRQAPWILASQTPSAEVEMSALSAGAVEYLPLTDNSNLARLRLARVLNDRHSMAAEERQSKVDSLTKLPTRQALLEKLDRQLARSAEMNEPLSVLVFSIDQFKNFNKSCGYITGDACLVKAAKCLKKSLQEPGHVLVRFGGSEFAVLLPGPSAAEARQIGTRLCLAFAEAQLGSEALATGEFLTLSMGSHTVSTVLETSKYDLIDGAITDLSANQESS